MAIDKDQLQKEMDEIKQWVDGYHEKGDEKVNEPTESVEETKTEEVTDKEPEPKEEVVADTEKPVTEDEGKNDFKQLENSIHQSQFNTSQEMERLSKEVTEKTKLLRRKRKRTHFEKGITNLIRLHGQIFKIILMSLALFRRI